MTSALIQVSDQELVDSIKRLVKKEQRCLHQIILNFAEFDRRRLYAELGYSSLFDYATRGLGYSPASAQRRIKAAWAVAAVPEVYQCLVEGKLSLSVLEVVADAISGTNGREILKEACGVSKDDVLRIVSRFYSVKDWALCDSIVPITVKTESAVGLVSDESSNYFRAEVNRKQVVNFGVEIQEKFRISFAASPEFKEKLDRVKELLPFGFDTEDVLERALDEFIKRHAPEERARRRKEKAKKSLKAKGKRIVKAVDKLQEVSNQVVRAMPKKDQEPAGKRFVTGALRDQVLERDGFCCSYVSPEGTRCGYRVGLEIDHIIPWSMGGETEVGNLRTVCKTHNLMFARNLFGDQRVEEAIRGREQFGPAWGDCRGLVFSPA